MTKFNEPRPSAASNPGVAQCQAQRTCQMRVPAVLGARHRGHHQLLEGSCETYRHSIQCNVLGSTGNLLQPAMELLGGNCRQAA